MASKKIKKVKKKIKKIKKDKKKIVDKKLNAPNIYKSNVFKTNEEKVKNLPR